MTTESTGQDQPAETEALQAVVDRVTSWQDGAVVEKVREELGKGVDEAGIEVPSSLLDELARRIHADQDRVEVAQVVTAHGDEVEPD